MQAKIRLFPGGTDEPNRLFMKRVGISSLDPFFFLFSPSSSSALTLFRAFETYII